MTATKKPKKIGRPKDSHTNPQMASTPPPTTPPTTPPTADGLDLDTLQALTPFQKTTTTTTTNSSSNNNNNRTTTSNQQDNEEGEEQNAGGEKKQNGVGEDLVTRAARDLLLSCIKNESRVRHVFFQNVQSPSGLKLLDFRGFPLEELAVNFLTEAVVKTKDQFGFYKTIDRAKVEGGLRDIYDSLQWKKLGFQLYTSLYPDVVKDPVSGIKLRDFMGEEGHIWAEQLVSQVTAPQFTKTWQSRLVRCQTTEGQYNQEMNALFVKLHLLDPQSVIPAYQYLLNQRALPAVNLELATRNYLGGPLNYRLVQSFVEDAERKPATPVHASRLSQSPEVEVYHGVDVEEFIITEGRNLGFWNGTRPDNCRQVKTKDKCLVM